MKKFIISVPKVDRPIPEKLQAYLASTKYTVQFTKNLGQELARTTLVANMLSGDYDAIAFIDSDMSPNIDMDAMFEKFYNLNLPIVSALTSSKGRQHQMLIFRKNPNITYPILDETMYVKDCIIPVYAIGFGACLIRREVFEKLDMPWFKTNWEYVIPENGDIRTVGGTGMGADFYFSLKCQKNEIPIHLDCGSLVHHMDIDNNGSSYRGHEFPWPETMEKIEKEAAVKYG